LCEQGSSLYFYTGYPPRPDSYRDTPPEEGICTPHQHNSPPGRGTKGVGSPPSSTFSGISQQFFIFLIDFTKATTMEDDKMKKFDSSENLQRMVLNIMYVMREKYVKYPEYKTIMMNLTTVSKEINSIRIKEISGLTVDGEEKKTP
jgi:hypothetical protein